MDAVLERRPLLHEVEAESKDLTRLSHLGRRHVGRRNQVGAQKVGECPRVDSVRLHSGCGDGTNPEGMGQEYFVYHRLQHVEDKVPVAARLQRGSLLPLDRKSTRLNSSHGYISYSFFFFK